VVGSVSQIRAGWRTQIRSALAWAVLSLTSAAQVTHTTEMVTDADASDVSSLLGPLSTEEPMDLWKSINVSVASAGKRFRDTRVGNASALRDIASLAGVTPRAIRHWENGDSLPPLGSLVEICRKFGWSPIYIVTGLPARLSSDFVEREVQCGRADASNIDLADYISASPIDIGQRLRNARVSRKISLAGLGRHLGKSRQAILHWETGTNNASLDDIVTVATLLEADPIQIMFGLAYDLEVMVNDAIEIIDPSEFKAGMHRPILSCRPVEGLPERNPLRKTAPKRLEGKLIPWVDNTIRALEIIEIPNHPDQKKNLQYFATARCSARSFALDVDDNDNAPTMRAGDVVVVDPLRDLASGQLIVGRNSNGFVIGRLTIRGGDYIVNKENRASNSVVLQPPDGRPLREQLSIEERYTEDYIVGVIVQHTRNFGDDKQ
jgi:transcriptional regulator with XRE-family HTH domain